MSWFVVTEVRREVEHPRVVNKASDDRVIEGLSVDRVEHDLRVRIPAMPATDSS